LKSTNEITNLNTIATAINFELNQQYFEEMLQAKYQQQYETKAQNDANTLYNNQLYQNYSYGQSTTHNPNSIYHSNLLGQDDCTPDTNFGESNNFHNNNNNNYSSIYANYPQFSDENYAAYEANYLNNNLNENQNYNYDYNNTANLPQAGYDISNYAATYLYQGYAEGDSSNQLGNSSYLAAAKNNNKTYLNQRAEIYNDKPIRSEIHCEENVDELKINNYLNEEKGYETEQQLSSSYNKLSSNKSRKETNEKIISFHFNLDEETENKDKNDLESSFNSKLNSKNNLNNLNSEKKNSNDYDNDNKISSNNAINDINQINISEKNNKIFYGDNEILLSDYTKQKNNKVTEHKQDLNIKHKRIRLNHPLRNVVEENQIRGKLAKRKNKQNKLNTEVNCRSNLKKKRRIRRSLKFYN